MNPYNYIVGFFSKITGLPIFRKENKKARKMIAIVASNNGIEQYRLEMDQADPNQKSFTKTYRNKGKPVERNIKS